MPTDSKRTKTLHVYTPDGEDYRIEIERETRRTFDDGTKVTVDGGGRRVQRMLSAIGETPLPCGPIMVENYDDLRAVISACADALALEDEQAEAARLAALAAEQLQDAQLPGAQP